MEFDKEQQNRLTLYPYCGNINIGDYTKIFIKVHFCTIRVIVRIVFSSYNIILY